MNAHWLLDLLAENSILLLFFIAVLGHLIGSISIKGVSLGLAAVLFVGLGLNALDADLVLPPIIGTLGLILFVYSIGIASGPTFVNALRHGGIRANLLTASVIALAAVLVVGVFFLLNLDSATAAGLFTGVLTNTPAMAGVVELLGQSDATKSLAALPAVGYSIAYPMGVLGPILAIVLLQRLFRIDYTNDPGQATGFVNPNISICNKTVRITNSAYVGKVPHYVLEDNNWPIVFGRAKRGDETWLSTKRDWTFSKDDLVSVIGAPDDVDGVIAELGELVDEPLDLDRTDFDHYRTIVSSKDVAGRRIGELNLTRTFGAVITRVKRGDQDILATEDVVLEMGDRVRVLVPVRRAREVRKYFGDSFRATSEINVLGIGVGLCLGLVLGNIPLELPGGVVFKLGDAGGPLIVGLILGALHRTGKIVWGIPYSANLTMRELGLIMMLASIGTRSGQAFVEALSSPSGLYIFGAAAVVSIIIPIIFLVIAYRGLKVPFAVATGMLAATHTQPAVQAYATKAANNDLPNHGYAVVFPTATILKILLAQVILLSLANV